MRWAETRRSIRCAGLSFSLGPVGAIIAIRCTSLAMHFTGWPMLAFQVEMTAKARNVGCFYWSHDIGGHFGPRFEEATTRAGCSSARSPPVLRLHSARTSVLDRRPWTYELRFL